MLLKDLDLSSLPTEVLVSLKDAIKLELRSRHRGHYMLRKLERAKQQDFSLYNYDDACQKILEINSHHLLSLPEDAAKNHFRDRTKYLPCLLGQCWDTLFPIARHDVKEYYVYVHVDPRGKNTILEGLQITLCGDPFYVGKGSGNRAWDLKRNQGHGKRIKAIRDAEFSDSSIVYLLAQNLTEQEALVLEAKLIYYFGSIYDDSINGCLLNLADHIKPTFVGTMKKLPKRKVFAEKTDRWSSS